MYQTFIKGQQGHNFSFPFLQYGQQKKGIWLKEILKHLGNWQTDTACGTSLWRLILIILNTYESEIALHVLKELKSIVLPFGLCFSSNLLWHNVDRSEYVAISEYFTLASIQLLRAGCFETKMQITKPNTFLCGSAQNEEITCGNVQEGQIEP